MMYLKGTIETVWEFRTGLPVNGMCPVTRVPRYVCTVKTPGMIVTKSSVRSRGEALTEALKYLGMPMYGTRYCGGCPECSKVSSTIALGKKLVKDVIDDIESYD